MLKRSKTNNRPESGDRWRSIRKTKINDIKPLSQSDLGPQIETSVHNNLEADYGKTISTINYFSTTALGKYAKEKKWKLDVWLDEVKNGGESNVTCGVALKRPNKDLIYTKKTGDSINEAVRQSIKVLEKIVRKDKRSWSKLIKPSVYG